MSVTKMTLQSNQTKAFRKMVAVTTENTRYHYKVTKQNKLPNNYRLMIKSTRELQ